MKFEPKEGGYRHFCPGCEIVHWIPPGWSFDGNYDCPNVTPSVKITYNGADAGQVRERGGRAPYAVCHYFIRDGRIEYCADSTHPMTGITVDMVEIPE